MNLFESIKNNQTIKESVTFEDAVKDSYNHLKNDLGEIPSIDDIVGDLSNYEISNLPQGSSIDDTPDDSIATWNAIKEILKGQELRDIDSDYDKYTDETNWAAEEASDADERMERRYGSMNEGTEDSNTSNWFEGVKGLQNWVESKCKFKFSEYLSDENQDILDKAWNLIWHLYQGNENLFSKFNTRVSVSDDDILIDIQDLRYGALVFRVTFPDPYNEVNQFKGVSTEIYGDFNLTEDWFSMAQYLAHICL